MSEIMPGFAGPSKPRWEYRVYKVPNLSLLGQRSLIDPEIKPEGGKTEAEINEFGAEGWDLIRSIANLASEDRQLLVFRRSK